MLNKKGFTIIELIVSFAFVSILTASLFAVVINYKEKEQDVSVETELLSFKYKITIEIENDIQKKLLNYIEYCIDSNGNISNRCIILNFMDGTSKTLEIRSEKKTETIEDSTFTYDEPYILYGGVRYTPPDASRLFIKSDYMLQYTTLDDDLENNMSLYRIKISLEHVDIEKLFDITIVATGNKNVKTGTPAQYKAYNIGDLVKIQINGYQQLDFYVIENSSEYNSNLTLLLASPTSLPIEISSYLAYNVRNNGNQYQNSLIYSQIQKLYNYWLTPDLIRLITAEELGYLVYACPKYMQNDAPNLDLSSAPEWVYNSNYWTMTSKKESGVDNGTKVWVVDQTSKSLTSAFVDATYSLRPVIEINKKYVTN